MRSFAATALNVLPGINAVRDNGKARLCRGRVRLRFGYAIQANVRGGKDRFRIPSRRKMERGELRNFHRGRVREKIEPMKMNQIDRIPAERLFNQTQMFAPGTFANLWCHFTVKRRRHNEPAANSGT